MHFFLKQTGYTDFIEGIEVCVSSYDYNNIRKEG